MLYDTNSSGLKPIAWQVPRSFVDLAFGTAEILSFLKGIETQDHHASFFHI